MSSNKEFNDLNEMGKVFKIMVDFQKIHNVICLDFEVLLDITENKKQNEKEFDSLYRACLTRLFTLMEADIFGLKQFIITYDIGDHKDNFIEIFKKTYKETSVILHKESIQKSYFDAKLQNLRALRIMRNNLVHPKEIGHIYKASEEEFEKIKSVFADYDDFVNDLMAGSSIKYVPTH